MKGEFTPFKVVPRVFRSYIIFRTYTNAINGKVMMTMTSAMLSIPTLVSQYPDRFSTVFLVLFAISESNPYPSGTIALYVEVPTVAWMNVPMYNAVMMNMMANAAPIIISHIALRSSDNDLAFRFPFM